MEIVRHLLLCLDLLVLIVTLDKGGFLKYRPGQTNWEYTMWKFQDFYHAQILREINFGPFEAQKTAIFDYLSSSEF